MREFRAIVSDSLILTLTEYAKQASIAAEERELKRSLSKDERKKIVSRVAQQGRETSRSRKKLKKYRKCPACKTPYKKIEGCTHMTCPCGREFDEKWFDVNVVRKERKTPIIRGYMDGQAVY
jgi:hypothetical protein